MLAFGLAAATFYVGLVVWWFVVMLARKSGFAMRGTYLVRDDRAADLATHPAVRLVVQDPLTGRHLLLRVGRGKGSLVLRIGTARTPARLDAGGLRSMADALDISPHESACTAGVRLRALADRPDVTSWPDAPPRAAVPLHARLREQIRMYFDPDQRQ